MSNPSLESLGDFIFSWMLLGPFPEFSVVDGLRPSDPKDSSRAGVHECLNLLLRRGRGSLCFSSIQENSFYCSAKDPNFDVDGQDR